MKINLVIVFLLSIGCSPKIVGYINPDAAYGSFESYQLVNVKIDKRHLDVNSTQLLGALASQIKYQMEEKRSYLLSNISPDLILRYELVSNAKTPNNTNTYSNPGMTRRSAFNSYTNPTPHITQESVVLLELLSKGKLIWQGSYDLTQNRKKSENEDIFKMAINRIFTTYPYKAGESHAHTTLTELEK